MSRCTASRSDSAAHEEAGRIHRYGSNVFYPALFRGLLGVWCDGRDEMQREKIVCEGVIRIIICVTII